MDDSAYYVFTPSVQAQESKPVAPKRRRASLLAQPREDSQANGGLLGGLSSQDAKVEEEKKGPPSATVTRRAQSYSDFHYAVMAALDPKSKVEAKSKTERGMSNKKLIQDELGFEDWYGELEDGLFDASHDQYQSYLEELNFTEAYLNSVSSSTTATINILDSLSTSFKNVETQTTAFQKQCSDLIAEQKRVEELADNIGDNLKYYSYLEPITRKLNAPGAGNFVRGKEFSDMLARLDECLDYMNHHMSQREAPTYRSRYRQLLTRGLTLIRVNFVSALRDIASDVTRRIADKQLNDTTMSALLYAKFRVGATELKELAHQIRKRAYVSAGAEAGAEAEYQSLMNELYTGYSATRGKLILPLITKKIGEIALASSTSNDLVTFARSSIGYMRGICADEYSLWLEWFEDEEGLYDFLESICEALYDQLRPRIIHENQILKLCELCTLLQTRYFKDIDDEPEEDEQGQLDFSILIQPALEDAQTRLVFRAQAILRDDIENFKPKPADLDYPARNKGTALSGTKASGPVTSGRRASVSHRQDSVVEDEENMVNGKFGFDVESTYKSWYPTLRKAIWLLSRIYRLVNSTVFDDLAHNIVHQTTLSLQRASTSISSSKSSIDGQLFLLKHLLILKQQIVAFDIEYVTPDVSFDFSNLTSTFYELRDRGGLFDPRTVWRLLSGAGNGSLLPRVVENMLDAKAELDGRLRTTINDFCSGSAGRITAVIAPTAVVKKSFDPASVIPAIQQVAKSEVPTIRKKLDEYLDDTRTRETLVSAVQDQVVLNYESWYESYVTERRQSGKGGISSKGKGREGDVWDSGVFAEWALGVFAVGRVYGGADTNEKQRRLSGGSTGLSDSEGGSGSGSGSGRSV